MSIEITRKQAVSLFGTQAELARQLDINRQAVNQWPPDAPIPELQALKIRFQLRPDAFDPQTDELIPVA